MCGGIAWCDLEALLENLPLLCCEEGMAQGNHCSQKARGESYKEESQNSGVVSAQVSGWSLDYEYTKQVANRSAEEKNKTKQNRMN